MAGVGPPPATNRRRRHVPARGEWKPAPGVGWQHGEIPPAPTRLVKSSKLAWQTWFSAWFSAYWTPDDLPVLRQIIRLFDNVERGSKLSNERTELRQLMDSYGITKKGQQDRRWAPPQVDENPVEPPGGQDDGPYSGLRVVAG